MKFALASEQRQAARPGLSAECPICRHPMIAKCGEHKAWHWAHRVDRRCDPWKENETQWHRDWKGQFPEDWQEIVQHAEDGEKHIADVKTRDGWVIEFQHSHIEPQERRARNAFYGKLMWVVNGARLKTDAAQFLNALQNGESVPAGLPTRRISLDSCRLLKEWADSAVFFDFGEQALWWTLVSPNGRAYLRAFPRNAFIQIHLAGGFDQLVGDIRKNVADYESYFLAQATRRVPLPAFGVRMARRSRRF